MCFNPEVSIITYIVGVLGCLYLMKQDYTSESIFFLWVIHMQLIEFFLWKNQPCNNNNKIIGKIGMIVNNMEPIILWLAIIYFSRKRLPNWMHFIMILFLLTTLYISYKSYIKDHCTIVTPESSPHLDWLWNNKGDYNVLYYLFFLIVCILLSIYGLTFGYHAALIFFISFIVSLIIYRKSKSVGAMWCFFAAFVPLLIPTIYKI